MILPKYIDPKTYGKVLEYRRGIQERIVTKRFITGEAIPRPPAPPKPGRSVIRRPTNVFREGEVSIQLVALWRVFHTDEAGFDEIWGYSKNRPENEVDFNEMLEETRRSAMGQAGGSELETEGPLDFYWKRFEFVAPGPAQGQADE